MGHQLRRGRIDVVALLITASVAAAAVLGIAPDSAGSPPSLGVTRNALACPLTLPQEYKAGQAFQKMMPVLMHPRCLNCHGAVNPEQPAKQGGHLSGPVGPNEDCLNCHVGVRNLKNPRRGLAWRTPINVLFFTGRSARDLCNQFKRTEQLGVEQNGGSGPERFIRHMIDDRGEDQFVEAAYLGDRSLNTLGEIESKEATGRDMVTEPPPIPHAQLVAHAREWANTVGDEGWKIPDCGCRLMGDVWEGTVTTVLRVTEPPAGGPDALGTLTETMKVTARFEIDSSFMTIPPGDSISSDPWLVWKTTSGKLDWTVNATGGVCTTSASGSAPVRLGADGNPWGSIWIEPDSSGDFIYSVQIGPWPEGYYPSYTYRCRREVPSMAGTPYGMHSWWVHPDGAKVSAELKPWWSPFRTDAPDRPAPLATLKDSLTNSHPMGGTIKWVWDFTLVRRP